MTYQSDITLFLQDFKAKHPQLESEQLAGRARLWDKAPTSMMEAAANNDAAVAQKAYPYQTL